MPRTVHKTFRVTKFHHLMLESKPYKENKGTLVRLLLDAYFNNSLPSVEAQFRVELLKKKEEANKKQIELLQKELQK